MSTELGIAQTGSLADRILAEYRAAAESAETAIAHARRCGEFLLEARRECDRGAWESWVTENCAEISLRTARAYMRVARHPELEAATVGEAMLKLAAPRKSHNRQPLPFVRSRTPNLAKNDQASDTCMAPGDAMAEPENAPDGAIDGSEPEPGEAEYLSAVEAEHMAAVERILGGAGVAELDRLTAEVATLKASRDGFMNGKAQVERLLRAEQAKVRRLGVKLDVVRGEVEELRQKLEQHETAPIGRLTATQLVSIAEFILERSGIGEHDGERARSAAGTQAVTDAIARWPALAAVIMPINGDATASDTPECGWSPDQPLPF